VKDKLLFWVEGLLHFGIAKFLMDKYDCETYAIIDANSYTKQFFSEQKLVNFNKIWYFRDNVIKKKEEPNINYLKSFEEKYKINLWELVYSDRIFIQYNEYYHFTEREILSILEQECLFFEQVLDEVNPDFILMPLTDYHHNHLFHRLGQARNVEILMLNPAKLGNLAIISSTLDKFDGIKNEKNYIKSGKQITNDELEIFLNKFNPYKVNTEKIDPELKLNSFQLMGISLRRLGLSLDKNYQNYFKNYGMTFFNFLRKKDFLPIFIMKKLYRESFLNNNAIKKINFKNPFVYFPLHVEPERTLSFSAPFYSNQLEIIKSVARSLPVGYKLFLKEHYGMKTKPWRKVSFYKNLLEFPNVVLIHPYVNPDNLLKNCSLVVTISGTSALEAGFHKKPSIIFSDTTYTYLPFIHRIQNIEELPNVIRKCLQEKFDFSYLEDYIKLLTENSFEIKLRQLYNALNLEFFKHGMIKDMKIDESKMKSFLQKNSEQFEVLANEHVKKIQNKKINFSPKN